MIIKIINENTHTWKRINERIIVFKFSYPASSACVSTQSRRPSIVFSTLIVGCFVTINNIAMCINSQALGFNQDFQYFYLSPFREILIILSLKIIDR